MKRASIILFCLATLPLVGCIETISGPGIVARPRTPIGAENLRIIYVGQHYGQPEGFAGNLEAAVSREVHHRVAIESSEERQFPEAMNRWPTGVDMPRHGERTVLVRAVEPWRCGTPAAAAMMVSVMTLGILPFIDGGQTGWRTEIYDESGNLERRSDFQIQSWLYGWLPLVPFKPLNMAWRAFRGDEHDYFLRTFPSHLVADLANVEQGHALDAQRDARK